MDKLLRRVKFKFLRPVIALMFTLMLVSNAEALQINCERYSNNLSGFTTKAAMESYYPLRVSFDANQFEVPAGSTKKVVHNYYGEEGRGGGGVHIVVSLLPNGKLIADFQVKAGYQKPATGRYRCDRTSLDVRKFKISAAASGNADGVEIDGQNKLPTNTSDKKVCAEVFSIAGDQIFTVELRDPSGSPLNLVWIVEAKRRWGRHYAKTEANKCFALLSEDGNVNRGNGVQRKETTTRQNSMLNAKSECSDLGFSSGTEKHGECVLRLLELRD